MVARLKLKGIDGRAPPGVKYIALAPVAGKPAASWVVCKHNSATPSNCWNLLKPLHTKLLPERVQWPG